MIRKTTALLSLTLLFLATGCGGRTTNRDLNKVQKEAEKLENRTGTATGTGFSGDYTLTTQYSAPSCKGFSEEEQKVVNQVLENNLKGQVSCVQANGRFTCNDVVTGYINADDTFGIATKEAEKVDETGTATATFSLVGQFSKQDEARGKTSISVQVTTGERSGHCTIQGTFTMVRVSDAAQNDVTGLTLDYEGDDKTDSRTYRQVTAQNLGEALQVQATTGSDTTVLLLSQEGLSVKSSPFGAFTAENCEEEQFEAEGFDLSFSCSNDEGDLEGDLRILPTDDTGTQNL